MDRSNYEKWIPLPDFEFVNKYDVYDFCLDDGLVVTLIADDFFSREKNDHKIKLVWGYFDSFSIIDEKHRDSLVHCDEPKTHWTFYKTTSSEYIEFIKRDTVLLDENIIHFLLVGSNLVADILSPYYPEIEIIKIK